MLLLQHGGQQVVDFLYDCSNLQETRMLDSNCDFVPEPTLHCVPPLGHHSSPPSQENADASLLEDESKAKIAKGVEPIK